MWVVRFGTAKVECCRGKCEASIREQYFVLCYFPTADINLNVEIGIRKRPPKLVVGIGIKESVQQGISDATVYNDYQYHFIFGALHHHDHAVQIANITVMYNVLRLL